MRRLLPILITTSAIMSTSGLAIAQQNHNDHYHYDSTHLQPNAVLPANMVKQEDLADIFQTEAVSSVRTSDFQYGTCPSGFKSLALGGSKMIALTRWVVEYRFPDGSFAGGYTGPWTDVDESGVELDECEQYEKRTSTCTYTYWVLEESHTGEQYYSARTGYGTKTDERRVVADVTGQREYGTWREISNTCTGKSQPRPKDPAPPSPSPSKPASGSTQNLAIESDLICDSSSPYYSRGAGSPTMKNHIINLYKNWKGTSSSRTLYRCAEVAGYDFWQLPAHIDIFRRSRPEFDAKWKEAAVDAQKSAEREADNSCMRAIRDTKNIAKYPQLVHAKSAKFNKHNICTVYF